MKIERAPVTLLLASSLWIGLVLGCSLLSSGGNNSNRNRRSNPNTKTYRNSRDQFTGVLADNYVEFCFDYPNSWEIDPNSGKGDSPHFVDVEKIKSESGADTLMESFGVSFFYGARSPAEIKNLVAQGNMNDKFSRILPQYKKVSEGEVHIGAYEGYEFRFTYVFEAADRWGRVVWLPGDAERGVELIMSATPASPNVHGLQDVGEKGELPIILNSFRFGPCSDK
jgi:hypothetical protein